LLPERCVLVKWRSIKPRVVYYRLVPRGRIIIHRGHCGVHRFALCVFLCWCVFCFVFLKKNCKRVCHMSSGSGPELCLQHLIGRCSRASACSALLCGHLESVVRCVCIVGCSPSRVCRRGRRARCLRGEGKLWLCRRVIGVAGMRAPPVVRGVRRGQGVGVPPFCLGPPGRAGLAYRVCDECGDAAPLPPCSPVDC